MSVLNFILNSVTGEDNRLFHRAAGVTAILATTILYYTLRSRDKEHDFPKLQGVQLYHAWNFFRRRHDFLLSNFRRNLGKSFSFKVFHHNIIVLAGQDARRAFFSNPHLDFVEGYKLLTGATPQVSDVNMALDEIESEDLILFNKKLSKILNRARIQDLLPTLLQDITNKADKWGDSGRIDPFTDVYNLVFSMTARLTACHDLADNEPDLMKIEEFFMTLQNSATLVSLLLPWFPSQARKAIKQATTDIYAILYTYVENRKHAEPESANAIDILIVDGATTQNIIGFVMAVLFAGILSTGTISCWMLVDLAIHSEWREKCKKEIRDLLSRHSGDSLSSATLYEKLAAIPLSAWEDELPIFDACTRESHRISFVNIALRRNVCEEVKIGEQVIKPGDFLIYSLADAHLNPEYYPEPYKYDPNRWLKPNPVPNAVYPFLGWGAGSYPCPAMKVAKLEMKLILALFLTRYEFDLVDKDGKFPDPLPIPDWNGIHQTRPLGATYYFNFEKVAQ